VRKKGMINFKHGEKENGVLKFAEYRSTGKAENTPSILESMPLFDRYFT